MLHFAKPDRFSSAVPAFVSQRMATPPAKMYTQRSDKRWAVGTFQFFFIYKPARKMAVIISARDMSDKERKAYGRK